MYELKVCVFVCVLPAGLAAVGVLLIDVLCVFRRRFTGRKTR